MTSGVLDMVRMEDFISGIRIGRSGDHHTVRHYYYDQKHTFQHRKRDGLGWMQVFLKGGTQMWVGAALGPMLKSLHRGQAKGVCVCPGRPPGGVATTGLRGVQKLQKCRAFSMLCYWRGGGVSGQPTKKT